MAGRTLDQIREAIAFERGKRYLLTAKVDDRIAELERELETARENAAHVSYGGVCVRHGMALKSGVYNGLMAVNPTVEVVLIRRTGGAYVIVNRGDGDTFKLSYPEAQAALIVEEVER